MKRASLGGPIALIVVGGFFLAQNLLPQFHLFDFLRDWWPALLILLGVIQLTERLSRRDAALRLGGGAPR